MRAFVLLLLCALSFITHAQAPREKVGLVLSGGAARGIAHVGVLKSLEEQGIQIDAIAGTSMGAVVGGLYAAGYSIEELERLAVELDWQLAMSDSPPRKDIPFRRKQDDRDFLIKQKISFRDDGSLGIPLGMIQGQNLNMILESLLVHTSGIRNFDQLPIPFRAVATDISTGEQVIFSDGHLPSAIRASMSIPALFTPVEIDGRLLVDGGMANNTPVDVARQMGVDRLIVVDLGTPLKSRDELITVLDVMNQATTLMTQRNTQERLATLNDKDILIQPELAGYGSTDFAAGPAMIEAGYEATRRLAPQLATINTSIGGNLALSVARNRVQRTPVITEIQVVNSSKVSDEVILSHINQELNEPLNTRRLQKDMSTLYGLEYFDQVHYRVQTLDERGSALVIEARGRETGTDYLRLGINLSDDMRGDSTYNIGGSYRMNGINQLGAEWLTRIQLGDQQELYSEFYQPLDAGSRYFVAPYLALESMNVKSVLNNDPIAEYRLERYGYGLNIGRQIANNGEIRFGLGQAWGEADVRIGSRDLPSYSLTEGFYELKYSFDTLDNVNFPRDGEDISLLLRKYDKSLDSDQDYRQWSFNLNKVFSHGPNTWSLGGRYGRTLDEADVVSSSYQLGGAQGLSGFRENSLSGQNIALARAVYYRRLTQNTMLPIDFPVYLGLSLERGRAWNNDNPFDSGYVNAGSIFLGLDTPLGPLKFTYGFNDEKEQALYLNLGKSF